MRERLHEMHQRAERDEDRGALVSIYVALMDLVEQSGTIENMEAFKKARTSDYNLLLISECIDEKHNVHPTRLLAVTRD
jgi:hypothetical protein